MCTSRYALFLGRGPDPHHHLQWCNQQEAVIVVHPQYLKVRLFVATSPTRSARMGQKPLLFGPDLLKDLSDLYQDQPVDSLG